VIAQAETILADIPIAACKLGLLGSVDIVEAIHQVLSQYPHIPVILDPILAAGGGQHLLTSPVQEAMIRTLFPLSYCITPNSQEAYLLTGASTLEDAAVQLMNWGCQHVCITGTHENTSTVINTLYTPQQPPLLWHWPRLPGNYHGSGCTLAASLAGLLAQGKDIVTALYAAQQYTWTSLQRGYQPGEGQLLPNRLFK
jgi:hydroxymethylpyrimidine/phosphomethylpyrimidine kinase